MDFELDDRLASLRAEARAFAQDRVLPGARDRDTGKHVPLDIIGEAAARGWLGCLVPREHGGSNLGNLGQAVVLEEIASACASTHVAISVHNSLVCSPLLGYGSPRLRDLYLSKVASGEWLGAYLLTEPNAGSDAASLSTTAARDGADWVLNGEKMWITSGDVAKIGIVFARSVADRAVKGPRAISAFVVPFDRPGISFGKREPKLGLRGSSTVAITLNDVRVPEDHILGEPKRGFHIAMDMLNGGRIGIAIQAVGIARRALEIGKNRLVASGGPRRQLESFRLAEIATDVDAARLLAWRAAVLRDRKKPHIREASMAKLFASQRANDACRSLIEFIGRDGIAASSDAARLFRDVRVTELYEGTTEVQKLVIAKQIMDL